RPPNPPLQAMTTVALPPGQKQEVALHLPLSAFALCDETGAAVVEPGRYTVYVGTSQPDRRSETLLGFAPQRFSVTAKERMVNVQ
ncbi:MAG: fibronectin type III-like domain-contianing protein, partial [Clostridiales bacterium]|nr:fibronectin type III-like domain-contianing protein [Clostridiales bacterium]